MGTILAFILGAGFGAVGITLWALGEAKRQEKKEWQRKKR